MFHERKCVDTKLLIVNHRCLTYGDTLFGRIIFFHTSKAGLLLMRVSWTRLAIAKKHVLWCSIPCRNRLVITPEDLNLVNTDSCLALIRLAVIAVSAVSWVRFTSTYILSARTNSSGRSIFRSDFLKITRSEYYPAGYCPFTHTRYLFRDRHTSQRNAALRVL